MKVLITFDEKVNQWDDLPRDEAGSPNMKGLVAPGASWWIHGDVISHLRFACPCGCGDILTVPCRLGPKDKNYWKWDGNKELPTLEPSIRKLSGCGWHGHLTKGIFHE